VPFSLDRFLRSVGLLSLIVTLPAWAACQTRATEHPADPVISPDALRTRLFAFAHDSMTGRIPGTPGNVTATAYMAAEFAKAGLEPGGDDGTYFQTVPLGRVGPKADASVIVNGRTFHHGEDFVVLTRGVRSIPPSGVVYGGNLTDPGSWPAAEVVFGKVVVLTVPPTDGVRQFNRGFGQALRDARLSGAAALAFAEFDLLPANAVAALSRGRIVVGDPGEDQGVTGIFVTPRLAAALLGADPMALLPGAVGPGASSSLEIAYEAFPYPARNVVAILRGSDSVLQNEYVALTAHNDHIWSVPAMAEHDSVRAHNRVVRPLGADDRDRPATPEEATRIRTILDSLRRLRAPRPDSIGNGADDDGSGSVSLLEIASALGRRVERPRRSILFVSHTAEEMGLLGSRWFTDHPTVPREAIVAEIDQDMVGRGNAADLAEGGPAYLEVIGSRRVSTEFGDLLEAVNARQPQPFSFNYTYDQPGHPLQYYCRADHYSYARYNIPAVALSRGEHYDYHQVTDEPQYIDYQSLARVSTLVHDAALALANSDHRPALNQPTRDPNAPCVQ